MASIRTEPKPSPNKSPDGKYPKCPGKDCKDPWGEQLYATNDKKHRYGCSDCLKALGVKPGKAIERFDTSAVA